MSFRTLNIGATALITQQLSLDVTGQNIANAATPGYSRQRLIQQANKPQSYTFGAVGTGVGINEIKRLADEFLEKQVRLAKSSRENLSTLQDGYENVQVFFNELTDNDLSTAMDNFWNSVSDFANNVEDISTRQAVIDQGASMRDSFQNMDAKMRDYRQRIDEAVVSTVDQINSLAREVADLNRQILIVEKGGTTNVTANDLRDQRTEALKDLSGLMDITVTEDKHGVVTVTQKSRLLVFQDQYKELTTASESVGDLIVQQPVFAEDQQPVDIQDGQLRAMLDLRDSVVLGYQDDLNQLAASFAWEFNRIHSQGIGLNGYSSLTGATGVIDTDVTLDKLNYGFTPETGTYQIVNGNLEVMVHNEVTGEETPVNLEIDLDGTGGADTILYDRTNPNAANALINKLQVAFDSVASGIFKVDIDLSNRVTIESTNSDYTFGFGRDTSGVLAALGLNTLFTGHDARTLDLNAATENNPQFLAGARSFVPGDNTGVIAMQGLRETATLDSATATFDDYYQGIVGRLGIEASRIDSLLTTQEDILTRMENQREDYSGVNLDEELTKMLLFQRAFQSAARFITTADKMYESLINM